MVNKSEKHKLHQHVLPWTGERMVPNQNSYGNIEHLHRYSIVSNLVTDSMIVLDVACGEGYGSFMLSRQAKNVIGVDISDEAIEHAKIKYNNDNLQFINASATAIPLEDSLFDIIVSFETLEHLEEQEALIKELKRLLKSDGLLIISTPDRRFFSKNNPNPFHVKELDFLEFETLLKKFFPTVEFLFQKTIHGSIVFNSKAPSLIEEYSGNFEKFNQNEQVTKPEFIIALATSDKSIHMPILNSFFDAANIHDEELNNYRSIERKYINLIGSRKFRILNRILKRIGYNLEV